MRSGEEKKRKRKGREKEIDGINGKKREKKKDEKFRVGEKSSKVAGGRNFGRDWSD